VAAEVWRVRIPAGEAGSVPIPFPSDWNQSEDLFYLDSIWIDGDVTSGKVILSSAVNPNILDDSVGYWFDYFGGLQTFPNALVLAESYSFIAVFGYDSGAVVSLFGNRKSSRANPDVALVAFGTAIFETSPTV